LTRELLQIGWKANPLDECSFSLFDRQGQLVGLCGVHVDDLLISGSLSNPVFSAAMTQLEKALPFGDRKMKQFVYCGVRVTQREDMSIELDQDDYIVNMKPMPIKHLKDGPIPSSEISNFRTVCGTLAWPVINTQPQCAFDVSWLTSKATAPHKCDVAFANKVMRRMQFEPQRLRYVRVTPTINEWRLVAFHDAGFATRPSGHSQAGALLMVTHPSALEGKLAPCMVVDWICSKIDRVVRSSFEAEINSAQMCLDHMLLLRASSLMMLTGISAREFRQREEQVPAVLCGDNKGVFTNVEALSPINKKGERRLQIDKVIMAEHLKQHKVQYRWVNSSHQVADAFTKLSTRGARVDLLNSLLRIGQVRIHYCTESGRKEDKRTAAGQNEVYAMDRDDSLDEVTYPQLLTPDRLAEWLRQDSGLILG
jgi:hypothetical protein